MKRTNFFSEKKRKGKKDALQTQPTLQPILETTMAFPYSCPQCFYLPSKAILSPVDDNVSIGYAE